MNVDAPTPWTGTWCPQCGPDVPCDEDGCCSTCGATAVGEGAEQALALRAGVNPTHPAYEPKEGTVDSPLSGTRWSQDAQDEEDQRVDEAMRGERWAIARHLRKYAAETRRHASAMRADAGSQAEPEARGLDRVVAALEGAAEFIEQGRHRI